MTEKTAKSVNNLGYHAHIYYDPTRTRAVAEGVCAALGEHFQVEIEAFRDTPIWPHPIANVLVIFKPDQFEHVVPYLMLHRDGLDVLVHPLTEDAVEDHTDFAMWLGKPIELNIHTLSSGLEVSERAVWRDLTGQEMRFLARGEGVGNRRRLALVHESGKR